MTIRGPFNRRRPFPRWRGIRAGLGRAELDGPAFRRIFHGILVAADVPDSPRLRAEAALVCFFDSAFASHATAARVWDAPVPPLPGEHVTVPSYGDRLRRAGISCHVRPGADHVVVDGVRVSTLPDLFVELAEQLPLVELVVFGDWVVRRRGVGRGELWAAADRAPGAAGRLARQAAGYVRERVDSPMETRLRMLIVLAGLPEPTVDLRVRDEQGEVRRRFDLCWPEVKVIVEYDGRHHVERVEAWESDLLRREEVDEDGWRIVVVVAAGIYRHPEQTIRRIHRVLRERGLVGVPARPRDAWRPHFPGHREAA
jgi:very-short-patch-repair endonuclease